ncbi:hypothetical protein QBC46DRAFT_385080 [Diplogelasinospora grovesii]|uniref:GPI ethanolamine phosphate transferase 3 n=1 Tax=Diplogelasinospora grovesii TaxID=303347 RepID=A0AAN6N7C0_9PEZI|nr:hypothetical protein QBC46DRAFT_385080 [Diplogelasinospora grovesii]
MAKKLRQMDGFIRDLAGRIDEKTVLIVMGDHGMDEKGDHGGESDDEVEAALWMYSPKPVFGRTKQEYNVPPGTAKERPVNQIDLVPTLALLMGIPIPYNNLGRPIEEAFAGVDGNGWDNLAAAEWTTAAGIKRYQASYLAARGMTTASTEEPGSPADLWAKAEEALLSVSQQQAKLKPKQRSKSDWEPVYSAFQTYQEETLRRCKSLWARFDLQSMGQGLLIMAFGVISLLLYVAGGQKEEDVIDDPELDAAEKILEAQGAQGEEKPSQERQLVRIGLLSASIGGVVGFLVQTFIPPLRVEAAWRHPVAFAALFSVLSVTVTLSKNTLSKLLPRTVWGWLAVIFTLSQSIGFASNSYTIWEDTMLLFFQATFGLATTLHSFTLPSLADRYLSIYHSILFVLLGRVASFSKLCREEQMPYCESTYYASSTSSTSSIWQLAIPFMVFLALPSLIKAYLTPTRSYEGLAPTWIGYVFRTGLFLSATYWVLDAADNNQWLPAELPLKNISVYTAQLVLGLAFVAGTTAFLWTPPCLHIITQSATASNRAAQITVLGYGNAHGARYLLLVVNILGGAILVSKPVGGGALAVMMWQIMSLLEILDLNNLTPDTTVIGGVVLAVLGQFYFFKTGHQATLSSIQWDSAFIPLFTIRYPWSPLVVMLNTFAGQIIAVVSVPLLVLWKSDPRKKGILESVSKRALGGFVAYYATEALATMAWAGHLRRHLMLYRVFGPRFMTAAIVLLVVDMMGILVSLTGVRVNTIAVSEVFGWMS